MLEFAIEGHDGAAKTPVIKGVKDKLIKRGLNVEVFAPFHIVREKIPEEDIYPYWAQTNSAKKAMDLLEETIQDIKTANSELDIILYDRHWMTILSETDHRPKLKYYWTNFIPTIFAEATIEKILMCSRFSFDIPWTKSREQVEKYHQIYLHLAKKYQENIYDKFLVTDKSQDLTPIITSVSETIIKTYELT